MATIYNVVLSADKTQVYVGEPVTFDVTVNLSAIFPIDPQVYVIWIRAYANNLPFYDYFIQLQYPLKTYSHRFIWAFNQPGTYQIYVEAQIVPR